MLWWCNITFITTIQPAHVHIHSSHKLCSTSCLENKTPFFCCKFWFLRCFLTGPFILVPNRQRLLNSRLLQMRLVRFSVQQWYIQQNTRLSILYNYCIAENFQGRKLSWIATKLKFEKVFRYTVLRMSFTRLCQTNSICYSYVLWRLPHCLRNH